ncbi:MAG: DUF488 domain-containing protein, partial [Anaerolineae bacterium]|nr:DUF488 domain-containing protein [Anaerolineae bacterium]
EGVTILVDTRNSDYRGRYSYDQLTQAAKERQGVDGKSMRFAARPALSGKPRQEGEYTAAGQADYRIMNTRTDAKRMLDGMADAAAKGERIALLCACADTCTCHRTRWLARSLSHRGVDVGHLEPGEFDYERQQEEGARELYRITRQSDLPALPPHSDTNWRERAESWSKHPEPKAPPKDYHSPRPTRAIPEHPAQVLVAGSMNANPAQLNYASDLVVRAAEIGAQIHVGDNEQGVDARVAATAEAIGYENVVVWTAGDAPRNGGVPGGQIRKVPYNYKEKGNRFTQRDQTMIRALDEENGAAFFIDNGFTHRKSGTLTGTEAGYVFAVAEGKAARKVSFGRQRDREAELNPLPTSYTPDHEPEAPAALPTEAVSMTAPAAHGYWSLSEFETDLRQRMGLPAATPASEPDVSELPDVREHTPSTQTEKWQAALETAERLEAQRQRLPYLSGRPGYKTASLIDVQALPTSDLDGTPLGYTAAAVEVSWRSSPFKIKTDDWRSADTVSVTELAHFRQPDQAEG